MRNISGIIALDLDGTLLNSAKELSPGNRAALAEAAEAGYLIVPTTGRFYGGMPAAVRELPFIRYAITINGAEVADLAGGKVLYKAEIPCVQAVELMAWLDTMPVIYDCYMDNGGWMSVPLKEKIDGTVDDPHYRKMLHELRKPVPELKAFLTERGQDVQKVQFFTRDAALRLRLMEEIPHRFPGLVTSSSQVQNVEINAAAANKGEALLALAARLGVPVERTFAFGDGNNDLSMLRAAGVGIAMDNAAAEVKAAADYVTLSCDADGVARGIEKFCLNNN